MKVVNSRWKDTHNVYINDGEFFSYKYAANSDVNCF